MDFNPVADVDTVYNIKHRLQMDAIEVIHTEFTKKEIKEHIRIAEHEQRDNRDCDNTVHALLAIAKMMMNLWYK